MKKQILIGIMLVMLLTAVLSGCITETKECSACDGTGKCNRCGGTGWAIDWDLECDNCDGTGICPVCDGTGYIETGIGGKDASSAIYVIIIIFVFIVCILLLIGLARAVTRKKIVIHPPAQPSQKRRCPDCGRVIPEDAKVCPYCGKKFKLIN